MEQFWGDNFDTPRLDRVWDFHTNPHLNWGWGGVAYYPHPGGQA